ncbi:pyruvate dehydrogenase complex dihydrolipoamide acetyltransferase [soil metagenome]
MATKVHMEALSPTMEEGQVVQWLKSEGDTVKSGDVLAEIETDKATMELVARGDGVLRKITVKEGETAPVGEVIAMIADEDEDLGEGDAPEAEAASDDSEDAPDEKAGKAGKADEDGDDEDAEAPKTKKEPGDSKKADGAESPDAAPSGDASGEDGQTGDGGRIKASPVARRLASEEGVELAGIEGSGPGGRIIKRDVEDAVKAGPAEKAGSAAAGAAAPRPGDGPDSEKVPLSQMRKTIAKRLVESIGPIPHFFLTIDVDMSRAVEARARINRDLERDGVKISYNDIVLKATAMALARHPECNAHWGGDHVVRFHRVHLGVAVAIEDGLITPVIRDADRKGMAAISAEVRELAGRAREKKLKPDEYTGATFSVSNLGMFGIEQFTAVINPPEAGILAVGAMEERAVVVDGELDIQPRMKITMSCDHRVIDGALGSQFLQTLKRILEEPLAALV